MGAVFVIIPYLYAVVNTRSLSVLVSSSAVLAAPTAKPSSFPVEQASVVVERKTQRELCPSSTDGTSSSAWDRHLQETGDSHLYKIDLSRQR